MPCSNSTVMKGGSLSYRCAWKAKDASAVQVRDHDLAAVIPHVGAAIPHPTDVAQRHSAELRMKAGVRHRGEELSGASQHIRDADAADAAPNQFKAGAAQHIGTEREIVAAHISENDVARPGLTGTGARRPLIAYVDCRCAAAAR